MSDAQGSGHRAAEGLVLTGRVEDACVADLLGSLGRNRETGLLTVSREGIQKTIYVQEGRIVFAASNDRDDRLGEMLLREGMITVEQYEESGKLIRPGKRQGTILVELGYVTPAELVKGVKVQVESIVLALFSWRTGEYRLEIREFDTRDIITLNISTENLVFLAVKQAATWSQVLRGLGGTLDTVLERAPDADARLYKIDVTEVESHVYGLVTGKASVAQVCQLSYVSNFATCVTLYALCCCGLITPVAVRDAETLFREQVAEFERAEVREDVEAFNRALAQLGQACGPSVEHALPRILEQAASDVLDEHYDAFRECDLRSGRLSASLVIENVEAVESGRRRGLVTTALAALADAVARRVTEIGGEECGRVARAALEPRAGRKA